MKSVVHLYDRSGNQDHACGTVRVKLMAPLLKKGQTYECCTLTKRNVTCKRCRKIMERE